MTEHQLPTDFISLFFIPVLMVPALIERLLYYGISAITLDIARSERKEGLRACVSLIQRDQFSDLEERIKKFHQDHPY